MRARTCVPLLVCLLGSCWLTASAQESADAATIRVLETKWADSYKNRQVDVLSSLMSDDYVITMEDGSVYGKVGFISHTAQPSEKVDLQVFDFKQYHRVSLPTAWRPCAHGILI